MKKVLFLLLFTPKLSSAQILVEKNIDEFNKHKIIRTSWEELAYKFNGSMYAHTRINRIDDLYFIEFKYVGSSTAGMLEGADFMLRLSNDSVLTLKNLKWQTQCRGCGAIGINSAGRLGLDVDFPITPEQLKLLAANQVLKVRVYFSDGYIEESIGKKNIDNLPKQAKLILSEKPVS